MLPIKGFCGNCKSSQALNNVPQTVQNRMDVINMYAIYNIKSYCTPIPSIVNTLNNIYLDGPLWDELISEYYNENNYAFGQLFQKYSASVVDNIYHVSTIIQ